MFLALVADDSVSRMLVPLKDVKRLRENKGGITIEFFDNPSVTLEAVTFDNFLELLEGSELCLRVNV